MAFPSVLRRFRGGDGTNLASKHLRDLWRTYILMQSPPSVAYVHPLTTRITGSIFIAEYLSQSCHNVRGYHNPHRNDHGTQQHNADISCSPSPLTAATNLGAPSRQSLTLDSNHPQLLPPPSWPTWNLPRHARALKVSNAAQTTTTKTTLAGLAAAAATAAVVAALSTSPAAFTPFSGLNAGAPLVLTAATAVAVADQPPTVVAEVGTQPLLEAGLGAVHGATVAAGGPLEHIWRWGLQNQEPTIATPLNAPTSTGPSSSSSSGKEAIYTRATAASGSFSTSAPVPVPAILITTEKQVPETSAAASGTPAPKATSSGGGQPASAVAAANLQEGSAFAVYDAHGELSSFGALLASLHSYDVVLLGEYHDDPVAHHLQLRLLRHVLGLDDEQEGEREVPEPLAGAQLGGGARSRSQRIAQPAQQPQQPKRPRQSAGVVSGSEEQRQSVRWRRPVALSLEMFERDVQGVMDEYLKGMATEADLVKDARPWPNYVTDYRPLVLEAREAGVPVICANAPRRYVSMVGRKGSAVLASLPPSSLAHLPPLPLKQPSQRYIAKIAWTMQMRPFTYVHHAVPCAVLSPWRLQRAGEMPRESGEGGDDDNDVEEKAAPLAAAPSASSASSTASSTTRGGPGISGVCPHIGLNLRSNFLEAQNLWDASMADSIARTLDQLAVGTAATGRQEGGLVAAGAVAAYSGVRVHKSEAADAEECGAASATTGGYNSASPSSSSDRPLVVHICGKFHSEQRLGICEHLATAAPVAKVCVVTFVPSGRGVLVRSSTLTTAGLHTYGDWLVLTDGSLPRSFESQHPV